MNKQKATKGISIYADTLMWLKKLQKEENINISSYIERLILSDKQIREGVNGEETKG